MQAFRRMANYWFDRFPAAGQSDLAGRFRAGNEINHQSAFFELYLHELLFRLSYHMEVHPVLTGTTNHPDFLVFKDEIPQFYLEATLAGVATEEERGAVARTDAVYDALNDLDSPNFFLKLSVRGAPDTPPNIAKLRRDLALWLETLNPDTIGSLYSEQQFEEVPQLEWSHGGWNVTFSPIPKSPQSRGVRGIRSVGIVAPEGKWLNTYGDLKDAIERKVGKYGDVDYPFVVAVNVLSLHCDNIDIMNALYGEETIVVKQNADGTLNSEAGCRRPNGVWWGPKGPRRAGVAAVLVIANLCPWNMGVLTPKVYHNPWAQKPLDLQCLALPQCVPNKEQGRVEHLPGISAAEALGLPNPWPVPDESDT